MEEKQTVETPVDYKAEFERVQAELQKSQSESARFKSSLDKASSELAESKRKLADRQTDEEKKQAELAEREAHYQEIERKYTLMQIREKLGKSITDEKTLDKVATLLADGKIFDALDLQTSYFATLKSELEKQIRADLMKQQPDPTAQGAQTKMTKQEIMAIKDAQERQRLIAQNIDLFRQNK